ncbi:MAG: oligosaccharide flippase family protein [Calothrix sp. SM1_5_4]|nr:oligosaccharide flippase family protein [Calothrix sp. SM1_5_4]
MAEKLTIIISALLLQNITEQGLLVAQVLGMLLSVLIVGSATGMPFAGVFKLRPEDSLALLKKYRDFPLKNGFSSLLQTLTAQVPPILFSAFYSINDLGYYNLAQRIIDTPNTVVASSLGTVYYRRLLNASKGEMLRIYLRTIRWMALLLLIPVGIVLAFSGDFLRFIFGPEWQDAHIYLLLLTPLMFFRLIYLSGQFSFMK